MDQLTDELGEQRDELWTGRALRLGSAGAWRLDVATGAVELSASALKLLRFATKPTESGLLALVHTDDRDRVNSALQLSLRTGQQFSSEFRSSSSPQHWFEASGRVVKRGGKPVSVLGWLHDVSSRRNSEHALVQIATQVSNTHGEEFLKALVEQLATVLKADYAFVATISEATPRHVRSVALWADGQHADNIEYHLDHTPCDEVISGNVCVHPNNVQERFDQDQLLKDMGIEAYAGVPIFGQHGAPIGLLVTLWRQPVADSRLAESALKIFGPRAGAEFERMAAEARRERGAALLARQKDALAELSQSGLWQTGDRDALLKQIAEVGTRTLGVDRVGVWLFDQERTKLTLVEMYEQSRSAHSSGAELPRDGAEAYFSALGANRVIAAHDAHTDPRTSEFSEAYLKPNNISSMLDAPIRVHGSTVGVVCCEQVGPRRQWLPEEESFSGSLADFSGLAIDLSEKRILQEQLLQKQALENIGQLAGGVAHDFNNLLTAIVGSAETAKDSLDKPDEVRNYLEEILEASRRASELTSQLLGFARKRVITPRVADLNEVVLRADRILRRVIGEDILLETKLEPSVWRVLVDPGQFEQILVNLAINARDAMPNGGRLLIETANQVLSPDYVRRHPSSSPTEHVLLAVSDTGSGIPKDVLPHIFEPFFTTKEKGRGTGLGLATCYGIVMQAGGQIYAYSEPNQGTTFKIYLPRTRREHEELPEQPAPTRTHGREVVLLVEDDPFVRRVAERSLNKYGYSVLVASRPSQALELARAHRGEIALMITDVVMPEMSGRQLSAQIAEILPNAKTLFVSGYTENSVVHHGVLERGLHFLPKPFSPSGLAEKVRQVLDAQSIPTLPRS